MKLFLRWTIAAVFLAAGIVPMTTATAAKAQTVYANTVSACGTPNNTPRVGNSYPVTQDTTGILCTSSSGGGGGGAVTVADGADVTQGAKADAACANGSSTCSEVALLKGLLTAAQDATPTAVTPNAGTTGGCTPYGLASAASTNATNIKSSTGTLCFASVINTTATVYYLRLYNLTTAPTCSSATGFVLSIPVPANASGAGVAIPMGPFGLAFTTGIGFCLTGGGSSTDNTNAATGVYVIAGYK